MKATRFLGQTAALCLGASLALQAQETSSTNQYQQLQQQLRQLQEDFERIQQQYRQRLEALQSQLERLQPAQPAGSPPTHAPPGAAPRPIEANAGAAPPAAPPASWKPSDPLRLGRGPSYADIGLVGTFAAGSSSASDIQGGTQAGGHDPYQRGFNLQGLELNLQGAVDPYFRANANLVFGLDAEAESFLEVEEGWLETLSLPGNLQVRAGQMFTEFGRHNPTHVHTWSFVDAPLVNARFLGPDGLRNPGARVSWLVPTPFYSELFFGVQNSHGETARGFRSGGHVHGGGAAEALPLAYRHPDNDRGLKQWDDLLFSTRYAASFDLTPNQVLLAGVSAAFGPNARGGAGAGDTGTQIYGVDLTWKWKSPQHHGGFPFVLWQSEAMLRRYDAGAFDWDENGNGVLDAGEVADTRTGRPALLPRETLTDHGFYTQLLYGFRKNWVAGLRFDFVTGDPAAYERLPLALDGAALGRDPLRAPRWRLSPNLTWYPSEYSKIRLQYNYDHRHGIGADHSVWLQWEFLLGAHAAHKF